MDPVNKIQVMGREFCMKHDYVVDFMRILFDI